jgi:hypothetical protein
VVIVVPGRFNVSLGALRRNFTILHARKPVKDGESRQPRRRYIAATVREQEQNAVRGSAESTGLAEYVRVYLAGACLRASDFARSS